jgi:hypothetical protein
MRILGIVALGAALAGCASSGVQVTQEEVRAVPLSDRISSSPNHVFFKDASLSIGKKFWIVTNFVGIHVCEEPANYLSTKCEYIKKGGFTVVDVADGKSRIGDRMVPSLEVFYQVAFDDGRVGYINSTDFRGGASSTDPAVVAAECKRRGNPKIGMTSGQVQNTCWGKPLHVNRTETGSVVSDQYVYDNGRYVYLRNGIVESIQASGQLR